VTLNDEPDRIDVLRVPALHIIISQIEHSSEQKVGGKKREIRSFFFLFNENFNFDWQPRFGARQ
jgi:hypothetical protein